MGKNVVYEYDCNCCGKTEQSTDVPDGWVEYEVYDYYASWVEIACKECWPEIAERPNIVPL